QQGMKKLVLDLRDNGGGLLDEAVQIADELIGNNQLILYTEGKASPRQNYLAKRPGLFEEGELVVLIDEGSASASEVLAAAVQDWDRGTIVGRNSFGKGLVQEQFNLSDGSAMRLSVSRYYTPLGRNLQKPFEANQNKDGKIYRTRKGKTLYAQSGITPDVEIAYDSTLLQLRESMPELENVLIKTALRFYQQNKNSILTHKTPEAFSNAMRSEKALQSFLMAAIRQRYPQQKNLSAAATEMLSNQCCAMIAGIIWGSDGSVRSLHNTDPFVQKARSILQP
ncbi:MAG: carboxyl-terminal protease, partial [Bacteroidetes bacterium]|nr:carboxyl-terminal protease [Bacteroidota bacterium]